VTDFRNLFPKQFEPDRMIMSYEQAIEDAVAYHRKSCKRYISWWARNKAALVNG